MRHELSHEMSNCANAVLSFRGPTIKFVIVRLFARAGIAAASISPTAANPAVISILFIAVPPCFVSITERYCPLVVALFSSSSSSSSSIPSASAFENEDEDRSPPAADH